VNQSPAFENMRRNDSQCTSPEVGARCTQVPVKVAKTRSDRRRPGEKHINQGGGCSLRVFTAYEKISFIPPGMKQSLRRRNTVSSPIFRVFFKVSRSTHTLLRTQHSESFI
jgi:hypothetical protein